MEDLSTANDRRDFYEGQQARHWCNMALATQVAQTVCVTQVGFLAPPGAIRAPSRLWAIIKGLFKAAVTVGIFCLVAGFFPVSSAAPHKVQWDVRAQIIPSRTRPSVRWELHLV
jgi:hypothetical protein